MVERYAAGLKIWIRYTSASLGASHEPNSDLPAARLVGPAVRKDFWQLAEAAGENRLYGVQHLFGRASWNADEVRVDIREYVL